MKPNDYLFIRKVSMFQDLADADLNTFSNIISHASYPKGELILNSNDPGSCLFILKSGMAKISIFDRNGKEDILKLVYPSDFFGEMSLLDGLHRSATVIAMENSTALLISREQFTGLISRHPQVALNMLAMLSRRLRKTDEKIASLRFADAYGKVARIILDLGRQGEQQTTSETSDGRISPPFFELSRENLAAMAGVTRETASRILKEFEVHGCIMMDGRRISILDRKVLEREACF